MAPTESPYEIKLDQVFEGPMALLVHLIKKNEVDIYDIPIAMITRQYLEYLEWIKLMNIDFAGDFLVMASTLAQIKSRMLLPTHGIEDEEDPRLELAKPLREYLEMQSIAEQLANRNLLGEQTFVRSFTEEGFEDHQEEEPYIQVGLFELIDAFQKILANIPEEHRLDLSTDRISVKERISEIVDILEKKDSLTFYELFSKNADKGDIIVTFLALLEMVKLNLVQIIQHLESGILRIFYV
ncbi:MAG: segregation/condensation protein A [Deltaproteobacteria bacterium]|nr:segregation/condensation protein A [Deltaproteobacteria bacterium]